MAKMKATETIGPALGGFSGIVMADVIAGWVASTKIGDVLGAWTPVVTSVLVGSAGLAIIPRSSAAMKAGGIAFAGANFGLAISNALRALEILP